MVRHVQRTNPNNPGLHYGRRQPPHRPYPSGRRRDSPVSPLEEDDQTIPSGVPSPLTPRDTINAPREDTQKFTSPRKDSQKPTSPKKELDKDPSSFPKEDFEKYVPPLRLLFLHFLAGCLLFALCAASPSDYAGSVAIAKSGKQYVGLLSKSFFR